MPYDLAQLILAIGLAVALNVRAYATLVEARRGDRSTEKPISKQERDQSYGNTDHRHDR